MQQLLSTGLIDQRFAVAVDPGISNDVTPRLQVEAQDANVDLEVSGCSNTVFACPFARILTRHNDDRLIST